MGDQQWESEPFRRSYGATKEATMSLRASPKKRCRLTGRPSAWPSAVFTGGVARGDCDYRHPGRDAVADVEQGQGQR